MITVCERDFFMISLQQIENLIEITSTTKIQELINYLNGKNISELNPLFVQEDLNLDENQIDSLTKILTQIKDVDLLLVTLESVSLCHEQKNDQLLNLIDLLHQILTHLLQSI